MFYTAFSSIPTILRWWTQEIGFIHRTSVRHAYTVTTKLPQKHIHDDTTSKMKTGLIQDIRECTIINFRVSYLLLLPFF